MPSTLMLLTNPYRPDPRVLREARALVRHGTNVQLVAWDRDGGLPEHWKEEGVDVTRLGPRCAFRSAGKVISRLPRFWFGALKVSRMMRFDIVHCHDFDTLPLGMLISKLRCRPLLYDSHELYSAMIQKDVGGLARLVWVFEKALSKRADEIVTVNENLAEKLSAGRREAARIVTNSPDTGVLDGADARQIRDKYGLRGFVISYLGSLEPGRFVEELVSLVEPSGNVSLVIGGNGTLLPIVERASKGNPAVKLRGALSPDEALKITWASDLVIAMLDPANPNYKVSTPVKILDAMACGRPFITSQGLDIAKRVAEVGCGFVIPYDKGAFMETLKRAQEAPKLLLEMGRKGKEYYDKELSWEKSQKELFKAYKALVSDF
jgi:glycosyltransferase involved in cell wall biosynthesis